MKWWLISSLCALLSGGCVNESWQIVSGEGGRFIFLDLVSIGEDEIAGSTTTHEDGFNNNITIQRK